MIENLKRLADLRTRIKESGVVGKARLAEEAGDELYKFCVSAAQRIVSLEQKLEGTRSGDTDSSTTAG